MASPAFNSTFSAELYTFAGQDVPWLLAHWADKKPDHPFMIWEPADGNTRQWSYAQFWTDVRKLAAGLQAKGVKKHDKLLIHAENCPEAVLAWYASALIGSVAVTTNTRCIGDELRYFAEHSEASGCITQPQFVAALQKNAPNLEWFVVTEDNAGAPAEAEQLQHGHQSFATLLQDELAERRSAEPMLPVGIQYTSGTTSRPKAVVHSHANALWGGRTGSQNLQMDGSDVYLTFLPFFHVNAQSWCFWSSLWVGATVVLQPKFSASRFWDLSVKHRCTRASMIPFCFKAIGPQPVPEHFYKTWSTGIIIPEVEDWFRVRTFACWGMTETVTHATRSDLWQDSPRMNIGKPTPGYEYAIMNPDSGEYCEVGEVGDLWVRGTRGIQLFLEYFNNPEAMEKSFTADGWFQTGDMARLGEDGYFYFADRDKDVIKVGAENVSARQVEEVVMAAGGCEEVAVVAQQHPMLDQVAVVFAIRHPNPELSDAALKEQIINHCKQNLADFKCPREVYFLDELPRATLEKVAKNVLREMADEYVS